MTTTSQNDYFPILNESRKKYRPYGIEDMSTKINKIGINGSRPLNNFRS